MACSRVSRILLLFFILGPKHFGREIQRPGWMRQQQLSRKHSAEADHTRCAERVQHLGRAGQTCTCLPGIVECSVATHWENPEHRSPGPVAEVPGVSRLVGACRAARWDV